MHQRSVDREEIHLKNIATRNFIYSIFSMESRLSERYLFLNSIYILQKIMYNIKYLFQSEKNTKSTKNYLIENVNFAISFLDEDPVFGKDKEFSSEKKSNELKNIYIEIVTCLSREDWKKELENLYKKLDNFKNENDKIYIEKSFSLVKKVYNNWIFKNKIDLIFYKKLIFNFISTRLTYGFSWGYIKNVLKNSVDFKNKNICEIDWSEKILQLSTKFERNEYTIFVPVTTSLKNDYVIQNFNQMNSEAQIVSDAVLDNEITNRRRKDLQKIKFNQQYFKYKLKALDPIAAIDEVISRVIPNKLGILSTISQKIFVDDTQSIFSLTNWRTSQRIETFRTFEASLNNELFKYNFMAVPELKIKKFDFKENKKFSQEVSRYFKPYFRQKYLYETIREIELKSSISITMLETVQKFFKNVLGAGSKAHDEIIKLAMIDIDIENFLNGVLMLREHIVKRLEIDSTTEINFLIEYLKKRDFPKKDLNEVVTYDHQWFTQQEYKIVKESLTWFKNISSLDRNLYIHEAHSLSFFSVLSSQTIDTLLSLVMARLINKELLNREELTKHHDFFKKCIAEIEYNPSA